MVSSEILDPKGYILLYFTNASRGVLGCMIKCHRHIEFHIEQASKQFATNLGPFAIGFSAVYLL